MAEASTSEGPHPQFICPLPGCGQTFRRRDYLARHEAMHSDVRPYQCDLCGKAFGRSDVMTRHRKKCPGSDARRRSISPYSPPQRNNPPPSRSTDVRTSRKPTPEYSSILGTLPPIEGQLPLIAVTNGPSGKRKHPSTGGPGEADEDSLSDISAESAVLNERMAGGRQGNVRSQGGPQVGRNGQEGGRRGPKQSRRMPILDVDFPMGTDREMAAAATTLASVEHRRPACPSGNASAGPLRSQQSMSQGQGGTASYWSNDPAMDLKWLGDFGVPGLDGGQPGSNFEAYMPDAFFDFEAFLSSTLGDTNSAGRGSNFLTSAPAPPQGASSPHGALPFTNADASMPSPMTGMLQSIGSPLQADSAYHVPIERFKAYYQMAHWSLPPLTDLVSFAERTKLEVLPHFCFLHVPTFRLDMLATCLAFTLCVVGADLPRKETDVGAAQSSAERASGWDFGPMVRNEMTIMIMKSFSVTKRMTMSDYNLALNQSLLLLQATEILSEHSHERMRANMFRTTIVNTARQLECFNPRASHFRHEIRLPIQPWTFAELDLHWRRWIQLEVRRRTVYFIYIFDMLATIETSIPCICAPAEVCYIPLPAPSSLWNAPGGEPWLAAAKIYTPISLDGALRILFTAPSAALVQPSPGGSTGSTAGATAASDTQPLHPVSRLLDRFALHVIVLMLLRGVIEIGEGRRERGDWYDLTDLWLDREEADQWIARSFNRPAGRKSILEAYTGAIQMWRTWWDALPPVDAREKPGRTPLCEDGLPIFWLVQALLGVLASSTPVEVRRAFITRINFAEMLNSARTLVRDNKAPPEMGSKQGCPYIM